MSPKSHRQLHYNVALVDKLWNLKRLCESQLKMHIPLNMVLKDEKYRAELLANALAVNDEELTRLVLEIRQMEESLLQASSLNDVAGSCKKTKKSIKLSYIAAVACTLFIFLAGYLFRSFLPLNAGDVFVLQALAQTQITSAMKPPPTRLADIYNGPAVQALKPLFRVHGSNTVGEKLAPRMLEAYLMGRGATNVKTVQGNNAAEKTVSGELQGQIEFIEIHAHGSSTAFTGLLNDKAEMGMSSRRIKDQERSLLLDKAGDLTEPGSESIIGLDGLAIITHNGNTIASLSLLQLVKLFSGEITNWQELGGPDMPVKVYARDENSGTWDTFKTMVLEPKAAQLVLTAKRMESSSALSDLVAQDPGAIGFIGLPYVRRAKLLPISVADDSLAILPTHFTVGTEDYPLARRLYFYLPQKNINADAEDFIRFSATERGQSIVEDIGLVSQNIKTGQPFDHHFYPQDMRELIARSERLSINFRFKDGSDELDTKALNDLARLVKYVETHSPKRVQLFGFSDAEGDNAESQALSLRRAKVVEQHLLARGIYPLVARGMGDEAPLASSNTEAGRRINRRVEVWIL